MLLVKYTKVYLKVEKVVTYYSNLILPGVSVGVGETIDEEEEGGWQPISVISLQQSFKLWQFWSQ